MEFTTISGTYFYYVVLCFSFWTSILQYGFYSEIAIVPVQVSMLDVSLYLYNRVYIAFTYVHAYSHV
jgi:hypothetical protein